MRNSLAISNVEVKAGSAADHLDGLLGYVSFTLNGSLRVDGVTVRRTADGRITLSYPARWDRSGFRHYLVRPLDDATRRRLEKQVLGALGLEAGA